MSVNPPGIGKCPPPLILLFAPLHSENTNTNNRKVTYCILHLPEDVAVCAVFFIIHVIAGVSEVGVVCDADHEVDDRPKCPQQGHDTQRQ